MTKLIASIVVALFGLVAVGAQAASHAGGAPMPASAPAAKKDDKKDAKKADEKKADDKKTEEKKTEEKKK
jgi:uncharacterized membrane protein YdbT with pleckstrin-like domain